jgi:hypothetical protein
MNHFRFVLERNSAKNFSWLRATWKSMKNGTWKVVDNIVSFKDILGQGRDYGLETSEKSGKGT